MSKDTGYLDNFFDTNEIIFNVGGMWMYNTKEMSKKRKVLQIIWTTVSYISSVIFYVLEFLSLQETIKDVYTFFAHMGILWSHTLGILKLVLMLSQYERIERLICSLHDKNFQYQSFEDFHPAQTFFEEKMYARKFTIMTSALYTLVAILSHISSVVVMYKDETYSEGQFDCQKVMPFYFYIPIEIHTRKRCLYTLVYVEYCLFIFAWFIGAYDGFFLALLSCFKTQLKILRGAIRTIRKRVLWKLNLNKNLKIFCDENVPLFEEELYKEFIHVTKHLILLLRIIKEIEDVFNMMILAQTLSSLCNVASCLFAVAQVPIGSLQFFVAIQYFVSMLVEFGLLCWFGSEITRAGEEILYALYSCGWISSSRRFKSSLIITMTRMQRPIQLTIGKFFPLTLSVTVSVCRASYSYYTVFRRS